MESAFVTAIGDGVTAVIDWGGEVLTSITSGGMAAVLPVVGIAIGIGIVGWGIATIKSLVWGM